MNHEDKDILEDLEPDNADAIKGGDGDRVSNEAVAARRKAKDTLRSQGVDIDEARR